MANYLIDYKPGELVSDTDLRAEFNDYLNDQNNGEYVVLNVPGFIDVEVQAAEFLNEHMPELYAKAEAAWYEKYVTETDSWYRNPDLERDYRLDR